PVLNVDLWQQLEQVAAPYQIDWQWVRGHDGNPGNEQVDALAQQQAAYYQQQ
nr:ribonuclease HI [Pseudomonadota bacterium]